jgi:microcystin-dependent protein
MDPLIGEIRVFAGNFAPRDWAFCEGQLLDIPSYQALFCILGTTYGGDGQRNFGLPDLRGRVIVGPNGDDYQIGQLGEFASAAADDQLAATSVPYQAIHHIISLSGTFPTSD